MGERRYKAFISYSHRDQKVAGWLHRKLETYRLPAALVGTSKPRRLHPIFKDREELPAADSLGEAIERAISNSDALIVLCSPAAAASPWIAKEIEHYKRLNGDRNIFPVIVEGEPPENFPAPLLVHYQDGAPTDEAAEPIAADLRDEGDGRKLALLKLVAGVAGVNLDDLVRRDQARKQKRWAAVAAASLAGMVGTSGLALYAIDQRDEAREQRAEADGMIEFMLTDLRDRLEPVGRLDVLEAVGARSLDYYSRQDLADLSADELGKRARAMLLVAEVADLQGRNEEAAQAFAEAHRSTGELYARNPDNWQRVYDHAQSEFWMAYEATNRGAPEEALPYFEAYRDLANRLVEIDPDREESKVEAVSGEINIGTALVDLGRLEEALPNFDKAIQLSGDFDPPTRDSALNHNLAIGHKASALTKLGRDSEALEARNAQIAILGHPVFDEDDAQVMEALAIIAAQKNDLLLSLGRAREARENVAASAAMWDALLERDPSNQFWRSQSHAVRLDQFFVQHATQPTEAASLLDRLIADQRQLVAAGSDDYFDVQLLEFLGVRACLEDGSSILAGQLVKAREAVDDISSSQLATSLIAEGNLRTKLGEKNGPRMMREAPSKHDGRVLSSWDRAHLKMIGDERGEGIDLSQFYLGFFAGPARRLAASGSGV